MDQIYERGLERMMGADSIIRSFPQPDSKAALTASNEKAKLYLHRIGEASKFQTS